MVRAATSRDVARLAGVAQSTVSNVLNDRQPIAPATRERVLAAMAELNYRPNLAARAMRTRRTGRLAVVLPGVTAVPTRLLVGASAAAVAGGYSLELHGLPGDQPTRAARLAELVDSNQYEGVLLLSPIAGVTDQKAPDGVVLLTLTTFDQEMRTRDDMTDASPIAAFVERLAAHGHRRFLHVAGPQTYPSARARLEAFTEVTTRLGVESLGTVIGEWSSQTGLEAIRTLPADVLSEHSSPLAVIAGSDTIAVGVVRGAWERGWNVPNQLSVTGWDDREIGRFLGPSLTTVRTDEEGMGRLAVEQVLALIRGEEPPAWAAPTQEIIWRESTP